jgi:hypothetical protein
MSGHQFDPDIAAQVGCNAAVIYHNLLHWAQKNAANNRHFYDGCWWTYNSVSAFAELFPYLTGKQIRTALDKLEASGLIISGHFNKASYDRTKWYSPTCLNQQIHLPKKANQIAQKGEPIPNINTDSKPIRNISAHEMPDDWEPMKFKVGSASRDIVDSWPPETYVPTLEAFVAYHRSRGNKFKNWQDAWSNWVLNSRKFKNGTTNRTTGQPRNQNGFAAALRYVADGRSDDPF